MNWYNIYKQSMPLPRGTPKPEDVSHYQKTLEYFDEKIDPALKERLDNERRREYIGHGAYGIAYEVDDIHGHNPNGKLVEKLTSEDYEYSNAQYLMQNQKNRDDYPVARVYDAEVLRKGEAKDSGVSRIFLEHVDNVSKEFALLWNTIDLCSMNYKGLEENRDAIISCSVGRVADEDWMFEIFDEGYEIDDILNVKTIDPPKLVKSLNETFDQLVDLEQRLKKYGFSPEDHHGANVGYRGNHLVILDLGAFARYE
jgi:hypothetical protein